MSSEDLHEGEVIYEPTRVPPPGRAEPPRRTAWGPTLLIGCLIAVFAGLAILVLAVVALVLVGLVGAAGGTVYAAGVHRGVQVVEATVSGAPGDRKLAMIPVQGVFLPGGGPLTARHPARVLRAMLKQAREDELVDGIILVVDSPGGGITTCDVMHKAIVDYRKETGDQVLVLMEDVAASGGYYVSCAADHIMAHPTTTTGSIGVMMPLFDASGLLKKLGVTDRTVKSGEFKNIGSPFAARTPEQWEREKQVLDGLVSQMYDRFVKIVADGRALDLDVVRELADGRIYTGEEAKDKKLVDYIGYEEDAIKKAKQLANLTDAHVVEYSRARSFGEMLLARSQRPELSAWLEDSLPLGARPRLMYLWCPPIPGGNP
ncbi:MAG: signal peptide peptidase SppA [Planctomycetota bacterium]|jgi:protease-4